MIPSKVFAVLQIKLLLISRPIYRLIATVTSVASACLQYRYIDTFFVYVCKNACSGVRNVIMSAKPDVFSDTHTSCLEPSFLPHMTPVIKIKRPKSEQATLSTSEKGTKIVFPSKIVGVLHQRPIDHQLYDF